MNATAATAAVASQNTLSSHRKLSFFGEKMLMRYLRYQAVSLTGLMLKTSVISLMLTEKLGAKDAAPRIGDVQSLNVLPGIVLCAFGGIIADKYDKRRILNITAVLSIIQALMLIDLSWKGAANASVPYVMWVMVFTGLTNAFDGVTRNSIIKDVTVDPSNQRTGSRCFTALYTLGMVVGQGCSGYIVDWFGYPCSYTLNLLSFVVLMIGLARIDFSHLKKKTDHATVELKLGLWSLFIRDLQIGWTQIMNKRALRICIYASALITIFGFTYNFMLPVIVKDALHGNNKNYGQLAMVGGFGSLAGALIAIWKGSHRELRFLIAGSSTVGIALVCFAYSRTVSAAMLPIFFCGFGFMFAFSPIRGAIMHIADQHAVGKVLGLTFTTFYGGMALSGFISGRIVKAVGCPPVLIGSGLALIAIACSAAVMPSAREIEKDLTH